MEGREKKSVYEGQAVQKVNRWHKCCQDGGRGGLLQPKWTGYRTGGGVEADNDYDDFDTVDKAITHGGLDGSRSYFHMVAKYGAPFMESRRDTTAEQRRDWRLLIQAIILKIKAKEAEDIRLRKECA